MKNEFGAFMLWINRKLNKNHDALVTKIDAIQNLFETSSEASASAADILEGKTAFNGTTLMTGTMVNQESREATLLAGGTYNIPRGFHDGAGRVLATDLASQTPGTAGAGGILEGLKAWVAGRMIDGTMKDRRGVTVTAGAVTQDDEYTYLSIPEEACYNANSKVRTPNSNLKRLPELEVVEGTIPVGTSTIDIGKQIVAICTGIKSDGYPGGSSVYHTIFSPGNFNINIGQTYADVSQHAYAVIINGTKFSCGNVAAGATGYRKYIALVVK